MSDYIDFAGQSGNVYRYWFLADPTATGINAVAGNYAFVKRLANGNYLPLYFGQADNLRTKFPPMIDGKKRYAPVLRMFWDTPRNTENPLASSKNAI